MTRMTREFSLVLLGAGMLTTAYFMTGEQDLEKKADEQARARVGGRSGHMHTLIWIHGGGYGSSAARPAGLASSATRGGFGSTAARVSTGGGS